MLSTPREEINGHPLSLNVCDSKDDPNVEAGCLPRTAIQTKVAAVIGGLDQYPDTIPVLQQGGIPYIGNQGYGQYDFTSPISFPLSSGAVGAEAGVAELLLSGHRKIGILSLYQPSTVEIQNLWIAVLKSAGLKPTDVVSFTNTDTDLTSFFGSTLAHGTNGLLLVIGPGPLVEARQAFEHLLVHRRRRGK